MRAVLSDRKRAVTPGTGGYYGEIWSYNHPYPYGMNQPLRSWDSGAEYRYGFNGMETDPEVKGEWGNHYTTYFRQYDPRVGRWWSNDPVVHPWESPYVAFHDNPIYFSDPLGNCPECKSADDYDDGTVIEPGEHGNKERWLVAHNKATGKNEWHLLSEGTELVEKRRDHPLGWVRDAYTIHDFGDHPSGSYAQPNGQEYFYGNQWIDQQEYDSRQKQLAENWFVKGFDPTAELGFPVFEEQAEGLFPDYFWIDFHRAWVREYGGGPWLIVDGEQTKIDNPLKTEALVDNNIELLVLLSLLRRAGAAGWAAARAVIIKRLAKRIARRALGVVGELEALQVLQARALAAGETGLESFNFAGQFGYDTYKALRSEVTKVMGTKSGLEVHHLIEKRFARLLGITNTNEMLSIVLTKAEHQAFTNAWKSMIGYNNSNSLLRTSTATKEDVMNAAREVYKNYPGILNQLGL